MRIGANSGSLPKHLEELAQAGSGGGARRGRARGGAPAREPRLPRLQDLGQVEPRADDDPRVPDALGEGRRTRSTSASPRRERSSPARSRAPSGSARCSPRGSATRSASRSPSDPVEEPKTAFEILKALGLRERGPVMIACPSLRPRQRRRAHARRGGRGAARGVPAGVRGRGARLRGERPGGERATPTSASPAAATSASSTRTAAC